jgi:hypothetical protein
MSARLRLWLVALDAVAFCSGYGSPLYHWVVRKASDATDWGQRESPIDAEDGGAW